MPAVLASDQLELTGVCTSREETARRAAERFGAPRWFSELTAAVHHPAVELVTVAVRVRSHRPIVEAALAARRSVYCEWPLALNSGEAQGLADRARIAGVACGIGTQGRFSPAVAAARQLLARGDIGHPLSFSASQLLSRFAVESDRWWLAREDEGSGALHVATAHVIDTVESLLGPIAALSGVRGTLRPDDRYSDTGEPFRWTASDSVACVVRLTEGVVGTVNVTNLATPQVGFSLRVVGEEGQVALSAPGNAQFTPVHVLHGGAGDDQLHAVPVAAERRGLTDADAGLNVALALERLAEAVRSGGRFRPDFDDAVRLHRILEAIGRSSDERTWVDVDRVS